MVRKNDPEWEFNNDQKNNAENFLVVAYDFVVKHNILRHLVSSGCRITFVPSKRTTKNEACWSSFQQWSKTSSCSHLCCGDGKRDNREGSCLWNLHGPPVAWPGAWLQDILDEFWSSWGEPSSF